MTVSSFTEPSGAGRCARNAPAGPPPPDTVRNARGPRGGEPAAGAVDPGPGPAATGTPARARTSSRSPSPRVTLVLVTAATFLTLVNYNASLTVLPELAAALGTGVAGQAWLLSGVPLGLSAVLLAAGRLADTHGRRRLLVLGLLGLAATSALGATATGTLTYTLGRIAQGAASAAVLTAGLGVLAHAHPTGPARARALTLWGAAFSGGIAVGPLAAGELTGWLGWRSCYALYAAVALVLGALAARSVPESAAARPGRTDVPGAVTLGLSVTALFAALTVGPGGWTRPAVTGLLAAALVLGAVFVAVERRGPAPLLDLRLLGRPPFLAATAGALGTGLAVIGVLSYLPTVLRLTLGLSATATSLLLGLWSGVAFGTALVSGPLASRMAARHLLVLGLLLAAAGSFALMGGFTGSWTRVLPGLLVNGAGSGLLNAALPRLAVDSVPAEQAAMGSGANQTFRYVGSSAGVAGTIALASSVGGGDPATALAQGYDRALAVAAGLTLLAALAALLARGRTRPRRRNGGTGHR